MGKTLYDEIEEISKFEKNKQIREKDLSNCCQAPVVTMGATTKYYICSNCKEPCDLEPKITNR